MKNENEYFILDDTDVANLTIQIEQHLKDGCKTVGDITTYYNPDNGGTIVYLQTMILGTKVDAVAIKEKFKQIFELYQEKENLQARFHNANRKYTQLADYNRGGFIEFDSLEVFVESEVEKNTAEKEFNISNEKYKEYSKAIISYMNKHRLSNINNRNYKGGLFDIVLHQGELFIKKR